MAQSMQLLKRGLATSSVAKGVIKNVTVVGGGLMGSGIAQVAAQTGHNVILVDVNNEVLSKALDSIKTSVGRVVKRMFKDNPGDGEKFVAETLSHVKTSSDLKESVKNADLVLEAVVESMDVKHKLFITADQVAPDHTIFASNTSSLSISEIGSVTKRQDRFGGLHFFNPVPMMKLLEVIRTDKTSEETYQSLLAWGKAIGKTCITCKDTPGFVVNRLLIPYQTEAFLMYERGDASAKDIDTAMKLGAGHPMGPLELADYTGLDTALLIMEGWAKKFPDFKVPRKTLQKLVSEGKLGLKTGEGIHKYKK